MNKDIAFSGVTAVPSDYESPDGALALSLNLLHEDGSLRPVRQPKEVITGLPAGMRMVCVHKVQGVEAAHWVFLRGGELSYTEAPDGAKEYAAEQWTTIGAGLPEGVKVTAYGNTLVVHSSSYMRYYLWSLEEAGGTFSYRDLGSHLPEAELGFELYSGYSSPIPTYGRISDDLQETATLTWLYPVTDRNNYNKRENQMTLQDGVLGYANKAVVDIHNRGRFIFPFFVRYAYRLYDGSVTMQSAPVLMLPSTRIAPIVTVTGYDKHETTCRVSVGAYAAKLRFRWHNSATVINELERYKDIISSIEIYVSAPIYTYNQAGYAYDSVKFRGYRAQNYNYETFGIFEKGAVNYADSYSGSKIIRLPQFELDEICDKIRSTSSFHLLHTLKYEDFISTNGEVTLTPDEGVINTLAARKSLEDDYDSHSTILAESALDYNGRLNLANITKQLYKGGSQRSLLQRNSKSLAEPDAIPYVYQFYWYIRGNSATNIVTSPFRTPDSYSYATDIMPWLYYPSVNAYRCVIKRINSLDSSVSYMSCDLKAHDFLNGAYWTPDDDKMLPTCSRTEAIADWFVPDSSITEDPVVTGGLVELPNKIYTSEVNNPFVFPVTSINTIGSGSGSIKGISTAAKALSQGQFGQFPLYAFTDQGVWALEVSSTGTFSARQPITRDVCTSAESITQIDSAVLFATSRGIMLIQGSETACLTDVLNSAAPFDVRALEGLERLHSSQGGLHRTCSCLAPAPLAAYLSGCGMVYDYAGQRIVVYNRDYSFAYVYSLKSKQWGMMYSAIDSGVASYPDALVNGLDGKVLDMSAPDGPVVPGLLVTRPLKLEGADVFKTVSALAVRGDALVRGNAMEAAHVRTVLYGSRDLRHWVPVTSSIDGYMRGFRGSPWKYYRLAVLTDLEAGESLSGITTVYDIRLNDILR